MCKLAALIDSRALGEDVSCEHKVLLTAARRELEAAEDIIDYKKHPRATTKSHLIAAQAHLNMARSLWMGALTPAQLLPHLHAIFAIIQEHVDPQDSGRRKIEQIVRKVDENPDVALPADDLVILAETMAIAQENGIQERLRAGNFARIVSGIAMCLAVLAIFVAVASAIWPAAVPLCFTPPAETGESSSSSPGPTTYNVVCPSRTADDDTPPNHPERTKSNIDEITRKIAQPADYLIVEIAGLLAAGVASASALRKIRGTSTGYHIPVALALLKLPMGALTAVLGLLLMRGGFVPGLSALDTPAQIIAWAIIFGYSQELFTKFVDKRGQAVLEGVRDTADPPPPPGLANP